MPHTPSSLVATVAALGTICSLGFYFLSTFALASFLKDKHRKLQEPPLPGTDLPPISILKPLKGVDPQIWESFSSHCAQNYPQFQLIFGVSDPNDPAADVVRRLQAKYPNIPIELIVCDHALGTNIKVSNLAQMLPAARHEILLVNDSDIRVPRDYLRKVVAPLSDPAVGLVTCLYRGTAMPTLGSRLESLGISTDFIPGVLTARFLEKGLHFGLGSTLAFRRGNLAAIGGFESMLDYLADDYELGRRLSADGKRVELAATTVSTTVSPYTFREFVRHQLRWSRTIRDVRHWGYAGLVFTFGLPWTLLTLISAHAAPWAVILLTFTLVARFAVAFVGSVVVLEDRQFFRDFLLLPLRDLIAPLIWAAALFGNRIHWRGDEFILKDGRLTAIPHSAGSKK
jgi:ceramide glucosyltransferase